MTCQGHILLPGPFIGLNLLTKLVTEIIEKRRSTARPLLFSKDSATKFVNRSQPLHEPGISGLKKVIQFCDQS